MPVYEEIEKDKEGKPVVGKDGKPIAKKIDGKKIYITDIIPTAPAKLFIEFMAP